MRSRRILSKNCSIHVNIVKFLVHIISEHPLKAISLMFENETVGPCLFQKLKCGGAMVTLARPPRWLRPWVRGETFLIFQSGEGKFAISLYVRWSEFPQTYCIFPKVMCDVYFRISTFSLYT